MSTIIGIFAIGLMVVVLLIAIFSLAMLVIIPLGRFFEKRSNPGPSNE